MPHDVIISYSTVDKTTADTMCAKLEERGIRCWIAPRDILPGMDYAEAIINAIDSARVTVLILSSNANLSKHVVREAERSMEAGNPIIPFRIEDVQPSTSLKYYIGGQHWLDALTPPLERHIQKLAETISIFLGKPPSPAQGIPPQPPGPSAYGPSTGSRASYTAYHTPPLQQPRTATRYKGVRIRYAAVVIDWIVFLFIWVFLLNIVIAPFYALSLYSSGWVFLVVFLCVYLSYFIALEGTYGQTIGKLVTRIKVVKEDGSPITYREAAIRSFVGVLDGMPIIIPGLIGSIVIWRSHKKQRLGDLAAHTVVVAGPAA